MFGAMFGAKQPAGSPAAESNGSGPAGNPPKSSSAASSPAKKTRRKGTNAEPLWFIQLEEKTDNWEEAGEHLTKLMEEAIGSGLTEIEYAENNVWFEFDFNTNYRLNTTTGKLCKLERSPPLERQGTPDADDAGIDQDGRPRLYFDVNGNYTLGKMTTEPFCHVEDWVKVFGNRPSRPKDETNAENDGDGGDGMTKRRTSTHSAEAPPIAKAATRIPKRGDMAPGLKGAKTAKSSMFTPSGDVVWEIELKKGQEKFWIPYAEAQKDLIAEAEAEGTCLVEYRARRQKYLVDIRRMVQTNKTTMMRKKIRRIPAPRWEIFLAGQWVACEADIVQMLNDAEIAGETSVEYERQGRTYEFDLCVMQQVTAATKRTREIRRIPRLEPAPQLKVTCGDRVRKTLIYAFYYFLLFWCYWLGSTRLDRDGDSDFDPEDVEVLLGDWGILKYNLGMEGKKVLQKNDFTNDTNDTNQVDGTPQQPSSKNDRAKVNVGDLEAWAEKAEKGKSGKGRGKGGADYEPPSVLDVAVEMGGSLIGHTVSVKGGGIEARVMEKYVKKRMIPWFVIFQVLVPWGLWIAFVVRDMLDGSTSSILRFASGLESAFNDKTDLRITTTACDDLRHEVYRWLTYQFTHIGISHIGMNSLMVILLGLPLEGLYGSKKMFALFNFGVAGGALMYIVVDAHRVIAGMSGGCYALIGIHLANLLVNWRYVRFRGVTLLMFLIIIKFDVWSYFLNGAEGTSVAAHVGGGIAGLVMGAIFVKPPQCPDQEKRNFLYYFLNGKLWQRVLRWFATCSAVVLLGLGVFWLVVVWPPQSMFEPYGYCWQGLLHENGAWGCIRCGSKACIDDLVTACNNTCHLYQRVSTRSCEDYGVVRHH